MEFMMSKWTQHQQDQFVADLIGEYGISVTRRQVEQTAANKGLPYPRFIIDNPDAKSGRGVYNMDALRSFAPAESVQAVQAPELAAALAAQVVPMARQLWTIWYHAAMNFMCLLASSRT
jgi:hypothetical protein